jgi:uncharacterized integral membrane protein (TIGR00698 family)
LSLFDEVPGARLRACAPGFLAACAVAAAAWLAGRAETAGLGRAWLEPVVAAILLGLLVRNLAPLPADWKPGICYAAKRPLEVAIALLGVTVDPAALRAAGAWLIAGPAVIVVLALGASYALSRAVGLNRRVSTLVACGNSICGNSAIAAAAPVVEATHDEAASAIAFTAVLGVIAVLVLPLLKSALGLTPVAYGALAGLTVYAVPQVLAATAPVGGAAVQVGAMVKLARVMMLGPVLAAVSVGRGRSAGGVSRLVPWYALAFAATAALRVLGFVPAWAAQPLGVACDLLTLVAMAALGLSTDLRAATAAGARMAAAASVSLLALAGMSFGLLRLLRLA